MKAIKSHKEFNELVQGDKPVLLDFYADWCGPCQAFMPTISNLKYEMGDQVRIVKIDVDKNQSLSQQLQVRSIPTVMIYQNGALKWRAQGGQSIQTMRAELEKLL